MIHTISPRKMIGCVVERKGDILNLYAYRLPETGTEYTRLSTMVAWGLGLEPRFSDSKSDVLPIRRPPNRETEVGLGTRNRTWILRFRI
jgi:hypothetical protein